MSLSTMELSGTVIKQGYLAKQVWLPLSREEMDVPQTQGRQEVLRGLGRTETAGGHYQQNQLKQEPSSHPPEPMTAMAPCM